MYKAIRNQEKDTTKTLKRCETTNSNLVKSSYITYQGRPPLTSLDVAHGICSWRIKRRPFSWRSCLYGGSSYVEPDLLKDMQEVQFCPMSKTQKCHESSTAHIKATQLEWLWCLWLPHVSCKLSQPFCLQNYQAVSPSCIGGRPLTQFLRKGTWCRVP